VFSAVFGDLGGEEALVVGVFGRDLVGADDVDAPDPVLGLEAFEFFFFLPEGVVGGAHGAKINGRGVAGGAHGLEDGLQVSGVLVLEFVDDEEVVGGFAAGVGLGMAGHEDDGGFAEGAAGGPSLALPLAGVPIVVEMFFEAADAAADVVGDGGVDYVAAGAVEEVEQVHKELGDGFVFAGLAGHNEQDFIAAGVGDAIHDGAGGFELVGVEGRFEDVVGEEGYVAHYFVGCGGDFRQSGRVAEWQSGRFRAQRSIPKSMESWLRTRSQWSGRRPSSLATRSATVRIPVK